MIDVRNIEKHFGDNHVLKNVSFMVLKFYLILVVVDLVILVILLLVLMLL